MNPSKTMIYILRNTRLLKLKYSTFDFETDILFQKLYASIRSEPFKIPEDDGNDLTLTFFNPDREGWLLKMGEMFMIFVAQRKYSESSGGFQRKLKCLLSLLKVDELKPGRGGGSF